MEFLDAPYGQQADMNLSALRNRAVTLPRQDLFTGHWQVVYWQPDLFVPQTFAVGVRVESSAGETAFHLMDKASRLECFFAPRPIQREFANAMAMMRQYLAAPEGKLSPSPHFSFSQPRFIRGEGAQVLANRLFFENILAARPRADKEGKDVIGPDTEETRVALSGFLKQMTNMAYERIVREGGQVLSDHYLDVTLAPDGGAGSVISVCYKSQQTIEMKILRAAQDINAYATSQDRRHKAIFLLEPGDDAPLPAKERKAIDDLIGNECWKLEQAGFATPRNTHIPEMARDILDWATPLLAT